MLFWMKKVCWSGVTLIMDNQPCKVNMCPCRGQRYVFITLFWHGYLVSYWHINSVIKWAETSENVQCTTGHLRPAKLQISLRIRAVWSESSLGSFWIAKNTNFLHVDNEDSDQTAWMRRLIFVGCTCRTVCFLPLRLRLSGSGTFTRPWFIRLM